MLFDNIFSFGSEGAKSGEETGQSLFNKIPVGSPPAKIVSEESPEARAVMDFIGTLTRAIQRDANKQKDEANDPGTTSQAASSVMKKSSESQQSSDLAQETKQTANQFAEPFKVTPKTQP
jgi:hypothetical protein